MPLRIKMKNGKKFVLRMKRKPHIKNVRHLVKKKSSKA